ncbi:unnamed protein product [Eruca vesicaria subsp. sativa]|uniref:F-box domain-containing protein n=1 Tax=Eruca vesicaria subsp. sativa TaxID=29727 RepID=A0ABC8K9I9_ERUVS|nr:unnamed protein product [Eruca vesicaria subsp. sativa]
MAENRKKLSYGWEKLNVEILVRIFHNCFSLEERTTSGLALAHVCGGWRAASCDPLLWNTLDLSLMEPIFIPTALSQYMFHAMRRSERKLARILKLSLSLSKGNISTLIFPYNLFLSDEMVTYTAERCPNLRRLVLPDWNNNAKQYCQKGKTPSVPDPHVVFESIAVNCKNFKELKTMGSIDLNFAKTLVGLLPNLEVLSLRCSAIHRDALITILNKLKSLEVLNISHSYLVVPKQKRIIVRKLNKKIKNEGSKLKQFLTCMEYETCVMCQRTEKDEGNISWDDYEEGLWKADEISSLHL